MNEAIQNNSGLTAEYLTRKQEITLEALLQDLREESPEGSKSLSKNLKIRIARFILGLLEQTPASDEQIAEVCYSIMGWFGRFDLGHDLDTIVGLAGELETPHHASDNPQDLFQQMKQLTRLYLSPGK